MAKRTPRRPVLAIKAWAGTSLHPQDRLPERWPTEEGIPRFQISDAQWADVEREYGHELKPAVRAEITAATDEFIAFATAERAGTKRVARRQLSRIKRAADKLYAALLAENLELASFHLSQHCDAVEQLPGQLAVLSRACDEADSDLAGMTDHIEGGAWARWVRALTGIAERHDLPTAARKDTDKQAIYAASPFVLLILALQICPQPSMRSCRPAPAASSARQKPVIWRTPLRVCRAPCR
jgi:hypothetical protein